MTAAELLSELLEFPERREELLGSSIEYIIVVDRCGSHKAGYGFEDLVKTCNELYEGRVTKEKLLDNIENDIRQMEDDDVVCFRVILPDIRMYESLEVLLDKVKMPEVKVVDIDEPVAPPPPHYRPKLKSYDKRRNFKPKNFWNRIRSRCK